MTAGPMVILTGAGISAESGIQTFRDQGGLWENHRIEDVATPEGFQRNPNAVHHFYNERRRQLLDPELRPNAAHIALAKLSQASPHPVLIVTQNIDNLHERAGCKDVIHMHGELLKARCLYSGQVFDWPQALTTDSECPCCQRSNSLRPHIVWFGEMPLELDTIDNALKHCTLFIAIGTSGQVYPAAGFIQTVRQWNPQAHTVEINLQPSDVTNLFHEHIQGPASRCVPQFVETLLQTLRTPEE